MRIERNISEKTIHCRTCDTSHTYRLQLYSYKPDPEYASFERLQGRLMPVSCRLAKLHSDMLLGFGPDSGVFLVDDGESVMKILPYSDIETILAYQQEINRIRAEFPPYSDINGEKYHIEFMPITEVVKGTTGHRCILTKSPNVIGLNFQQYLSSVIQRHQEAGTPTPSIPYFESELSDQITAYYQRARGINQTIFVHASNFKVHFDDKIIYVTDLANSIPKFLAKIGYTG